MPGTVLISRHLPEEALAATRARTTIRLPTEDRRLDPAELGALLRDADGLVCLLTETIDDSLLAQAPRLRVVANVAVGDNNIDVAAAPRRRIVVINTPGVPGLLDCPTAVLASHIASASKETRLRMATMAVEDALAVLEGGRPANPVNPEIPGA